MPRREPPKAPETIEYICGGTLPKVVTLLPLPLAACPNFHVDRTGLMTIIDCGAKTAMKTTESIRCKECGHRVMYKPRTHRSEFTVVDEMQQGRIADLYSCMFWPKLL